MGRRRQRSWVEARALIQRAGREYLIIKPHAGDEQPWEFPGGRIRSSEPPEAALRHLCRALLGIDIHIALGQPPFDYSFGTHRVRYRYYLCGVRRREAAPPGCAEARWVLMEQLREYVFDAPTQQVVDWLLEKPQPS
ncbi:MAG TPA: NUDIX domain-containing protein [Phycisphaerae bacterium]|nr:NUDIX domain-containing protein [Phycisphaerae bacterium]